jgi:hypothetical protein
MYGEDMVNSISTAKMLGELYDRPMLREKQKSQTKTARWVGYIPTASKNWTFHTTNTTRLKCQNSGIKAYYQLSSNLGILLFPMHHLVNACSYVPSGADFARSDSFLVASMSD